MVLHRTGGPVSRRESIARAAAGRGGAGAAAATRHHIGSSISRQQHHQRRRRLQPERITRLWQVYKHGSMTFLEPILGLNVVGRVAVDSIDTLLVPLRQSEKCVWYSTKTVLFKNDCLRFCGFCFATQGPQHGPTKLPLRLTTKTEPNYGAIQATEKETVKRCNSSSLRWRGGERERDTCVHMSKTTACHMSILKFDMRMLEGGPPA